MFTINDLCLLDAEEYLEVVDKIDIKEQQKDFIMKITVETRGKRFFDLFCKKNGNGVRIEESKIKYLRLNNIPDGFLMEIQSEKVVFHIFELKKTPRNQLLKIGRQFHSANMHIESICANLNIAPENYEVKYYVGFTKDESSIQKRFNEVSQIGPKILSGVESETATRADKWLNNKVYNNISHINFEVDVTKIKVPFIKEVHNTEIYNLTLSL